MRWVTRSSLRARNVKGLTRSWPNSGTIPSSASRTRRETNISFQKIPDFKTKGKTSFRLAAKNCSRKRYFHKDRKLLRITAECRVWIVTSFLYLSFYRLCDDVSPPFIQKSYLKSLIFVECLRYIKSEKLYVWQPYSLTFLVNLLVLGVGVRSLTLGWYFFTVSHVHILTLLNRVFIDGLFN